MTKKALLIIDEKDLEGELPSLQKKLKNLERDLDIKLLVRSEGMSLDREAEDFFSSPPYVRKRRKAGVWLRRMKNISFWFSMWIWSSSRNTAWSNSGKRG